MRQAPVLRWCCRDLRTRFNTIEAALKNGAERRASPRTAPVAGSEEMLRPVHRGAGPWPAGLRSQ